MAFSILVLIHLMPCKSRPKPSFHPCSSVTLCCTSKTLVNFWALAKTKRYFLVHFLAVLFSNRHKQKQGKESKDETYPETESVNTRLGY